MAGKKDPYAGEPGKPVSGKRVIPVIEEEVQVEKRKVVTGKVRVHKKIHEREEIIDQPTLQEEMEIERVAVNRFVDAPIAMRHKDGKIIIPLFEEVMVVEKRLLFKEEIHISKKTKQVHKPQKVTLRSEEVEIERLH